MSITGAVDAVEISLVALRPDGGVSLSIRDVHYFSIERFPGREIPFVDLTATTLFPSAPWPPELPDEFSEPRPSHPLLWLRAHGATTLRLVAAVVIVLRQVH
ncbi:hypothetical protein [Nocardia sp. NPDC056000]|uniref:hypothetical protein n=1 Tax=Nocardia sp. NPDC056000 TaxID=3345674 RepID=UPI0035DCE46D